MSDEDPAFEQEAARAEAEAARDKELEGTFPTSDPPSSWAGQDIEPEEPGQNRQPGPDHSRDASYE